MKYPTLIIYFLLSAEISFGQTAPNDTNFNKSLAKELSFILKEDQKYRKRLDKIERKHGEESKESENLWHLIEQKDSINLIRVKAILDSCGWVGPEIVGESGKSALFLVIQHSDLKTQEKYLPMMKQAVINGKASASSFALLIDRIEMHNKRPQIYGSQILRKDGNYYFYEIIDEINVNKRRSEVGLKPIEEYAKRWKIEYKFPGN